MRVFHFVPGRDKERQNGKLSGVVIKTIGWSEEGATLHTGVTRKQGFILRGKKR